MDLQTVYTATTIQLDNVYTITTTFGFFLKRDGKRQGSNANHPPPPPSPRSPRPPAEIYHGAWIAKLYIHIATTTIEKVIVWCSNPTKQEIINCMLSVCGVRSRALLSKIQRRRPERHHRNVQDSWWGANFGRSSSKNTSTLDNEVDVLTMSITRCTGLKLPEGMQMHDKPAYINMLGRGSWVNRMVTWFGIQCHEEETVGQILYQRDRGMHCGYNDAPRGIWLRYVEECGRHHQ